MRLQAMLLLAETWLAMLLIVGCGSASRTVILTHPATQQTAECKVDPWGSVNRTGQIEKCVKAYEQAGYKVTGDSR